MNRIGIVDVASLAAAASAMPLGVCEDRDASLNELGGKPREAVVLLDRPSDSR